MKLLKSKDLNELQKENIKFISITEEVSKFFTLKNLNEKQS